MRLEGKVAIVTAAAGAGIGQATARTLAKEGANIVVNSRRAHERLTSTAEEIRSSFGVKALAIQADVCNHEQVDSMIKQTLDEFGRIDILVNNAGTDRNVPIVDMTDEVWDLVLDTNLKGVFHCCRAVLPTMIKQKSGKIVNISSIAAWGPWVPDSAAYNAAKGGAVSFTYGIIREVAKYNINVNAVTPGLVPNPFLTKVAPEEELNIIRKATPLPRDCALEEVANAVVFLASDEASYITGVALSVCGGYYMH